MSDHSVHDILRLKEENNLLKQQLDDTREVLSEISLYLSVGMGDESTTAKQYHERILEGIKMLTNPIVEDWKKVIKEKDVFLETLMQIEEAFIDGEDTYDSWKKMGNIARDVLKDVKF